MSNIPWLGFDSLLGDYRQGKIKPIEVADRYYSAIDQAKYHPFLTLCREQARKSALRLENRDPDSLPLYGIPFALKDNLVTRGVRTTCASKILENYVPPYNATVVQRLEDAGAIILGKVNLDEFAMGSSNENSAFGVVPHPTQSDRVPGGSSGGSAVAVKLGQCLGALGSDTGGSIRLPASFCGVVGFKPTYGNVSRYGLIAHASSLDQVGPLTRTAKDARRVYEVISGSDPLDSTCLTSNPPIEQLELANLRIGIPKELFPKGLDTAVEESVRQTIEWFKSNGAKVCEVSLPSVKYAVATYYVLSVSEASSNLARFDGVRFGYRPKKLPSDLTSFYLESRSAFGEEVKRRILLGTFCLSTGYYDAYYGKAAKVRKWIQNDFERVFRDVDVLMSPVAPTTAFKRGEKTQDPLQMYLVDLLTIPASLAGLPAISVPCGEDSEGLSIGFQMIGKPSHDLNILQLAEQFEKESGLCDSRGHSRGHNDEQ